MVTATAVENVFTAQIRELEGNLAKVALRNKRLEEIIEAKDDEIARLRSRDASYVAKPVDGFYTFTDYKAMVFMRLGSTDRWQTEVFEQQGIKLHTIQQWRLKDRAPVEAYERAKKLVPATKKKQIRWKGEPSVRVQQLLAEGLPYAKIAEIISQEFECHVTENAIKGRVDRIRSGK